jgi:hypothetical protein
MVTHIVMIKFKKQTPKEEIVNIKKDIENLINVIKELKFMEVGLNFANEDRAMDLVLTAKFDDVSGLEIYAKDATHQKIIEKIKKIAEYTKVVDYVS